MPQPWAIYRFTRPITLLLWDSDRYRLTQLPEKSIISIGNRQPDANRMIQGAYRGNQVLLFSIDLEERAELLVTALELAESAEVRTAGGSDGIIDGPEQDASERATSGSELDALELAQRVAAELIGRGHFAWVLDPPKKPAASSETSESRDDERRPLGRCS